MFQVPEGTDSDGEDRWDRIRSGYRSLIPGILFGLVSVAVWLFRNHSDFMRYAVLLPASVGVGFSGYAMVQFKENGGSLLLKLVTFGIMGLSMVPLVELMGWWTSH